jgi:gluconate 2-dehydrogenase gamma chain
MPESTERKNDMSDEKQSPSRRTLLKSLVFVPMGATAVGALQGGVTNAGAAGTAVAETQPNPYTPAYFTPNEWRFLTAAIDRIIPHDEHGPGGIESGVLEFMDRHMQTPYAAGSIWYLQGPFLQASDDFGYQGKLPLKDIIRVGIKDFDAHVARNFNNKAFADLDRGQQEGLMKAAEAGKLDFPNINAKIFFANLLTEARNGYFSDPKHGGNKNMGSWKMIGYPGMRGDYLDWVKVRDRPYPIPAVDLAGRRG